jgi:hypothetical protein
MAYLKRLRSLEKISVFPQVKSDRLPLGRYSSPRSEVIPASLRSRAPLIVASAIPIIRMYCSWHGAYRWLKKRRQKEGDGAGATVALVLIATGLPATAPVRRLLLRGRGP